jgi:hypothetical protein
VCNFGVLWYDPRAQSTSVPLVRLWGMTIAAGAGRARLGDTATALVPLVVFGALAVAVEVATAGAATIAGAAVAVGAVATCAAPCGWPGS